MALHPGNTTISFTARLLGVITVRGTFEEFDGVLRYAEDDPARSSLAADVRAASITTGIALRDRHLRGYSYLDAAEFPMIAFRSCTFAHRPPHLVVRGMLTLHGVTREEEIRCVSRPALEDGRRGFVLTGEMLVRRRDFGVGQSSRLLRRLDPSPHLISGGVRISIRVRADAR